MCSLLFLYSYTLFLSKSTVNEVLLYQNIEGERTVSSFNKHASGS